MKKSLKDYPPDWPQIAISLKRKAGWMCEKCGEFFPNETGSKFVEIRGRRTIITLTVHHKDRNPWNCKQENLIVLCSPCHCRAELPLIQAEKRREAEKHQIELFRE